MENNNTDPRYWIHDEGEPSGTPSWDHQPSAVDGVYWGKGREDYEIPYGSSFRKRMSLEESILNGSLTSKTITEEQKKDIFNDLMYGLTNDKNMLAKKIELIMNDQQLLYSLVTNQFREAIFEIAGRKSQDPTVNRKFQFLATLTILIQKNYDLLKMQFGLHEHIVGIPELLGVFRSQCKNDGSDISDPTWFEPGKEQLYDKRLVNNSYLYSGKLAKDIYNLNKPYYVDKFKTFKSTTRLPANAQYNYASYMKSIYGITLSAEEVNADLSNKDEQENPDIN